MVKTYASGLQTYVRPIAKPVLGTISVGIQGDRQTETINYEVDTTTGQIEFASAPDQGWQITAGFEFDVPVRFGPPDKIQTSVASFRAGDVPSVSGARGAGLMGMSRR